MGQITAITSLTGHKDRVWHVTHHPSRPLLASSSADRTIRIYNTKTNVHHVTLREQHTRSVRSSAWRPEASDKRLILATASFDGTTAIWERDTEEDDQEPEWECIATLEGHENEVKVGGIFQLDLILGRCLE